MKRVFYSAIMMIMALVFFSVQVTEAEATADLSLGAGWNTNLESGTQESPTDPTAFALNDLQTTSASLNSRCFTPIFGGYIEITKYDATTFKKLAGAQFTIYNSAGKVVEVITSNAYGIAKSGKLSTGIYKVVETKAPTGYELESSPASVVVKSCLTVCLKKYNKPACTTGSLNVKKVDENGRPLAGATFDVFNASGTKVGTVTTNANGVAQLNNLPYGEYTLVETKAPAGYELITTPIKVTISKTTPCPTATVVNKKAKGGLEVIKEDESGKRLEGAIFDVFNASGVKVGTITTNANGVAQLNDLPYGEYTLVETKAPAGYELDATPIKVTISKDTPKPSVKVVNKESKGGLEVIKEDESGRRLEGAVFDVFNSSGVKVGTITTDATGVAQLNDLPYGEYTLVETQAPAGYELDATPIKVTISKDTPKPSVKVVNKESKGGLEVIKEDESGKRLEGAIFDVFDASGTKVGTITTDVNGVAELLDLPYGEYTLVETQAPAGYELDATPIKVTVSKDTPKPSVKVVNKESKGGLEVIKEDESGKRLEGAIFDVFDASGTKVGTITTDVNGVAELLDLPYGEYTLVETQAPAGYELDATPIKVTISKDTPKPSVTVVNKEEVEKLGSLKIIKYEKDSDPTIYLPGAVFEIYDDSYTLIATRTTDANGEILLTDLEPGRYYVVEFAAPPGYEEDNTFYPVDVEAGKTVEIAHPNVKIVDAGALKIVKYANDRNGVPTTTRLEGATFEITLLDGSTITRTTDVNGEINELGLPAGTYTIVETVAPTGYILKTGGASANTSTATVVVGQTAIVDVYNNPVPQRAAEGRAVIFVTSMSLDTRGQKFWLIDSDNNVIQAETNTFGQISTYLPVGDYKILHAPESELTLQAIDLNFDEVKENTAFKIQKDKLTIVNLSI